MKIDLDDATKLGSSSVKRRLAEGVGVVEVVVKVREPDYVPTNVRVRAKIDARMFTGEIAASELENLERDPQVVSVAMGKKLHLID